MIVEKQEMVYVNLVHMQMKTGCSFDREINFMDW